MKKYYQIPSTLTKNAKKIIPHGDYCYDEKGLCPYWDIDDDRPYQYNGYCWFLEQGDWELESEMTFKNKKTGEVLRGDDMPIPVSLLWDQCKHCGINDECELDDE